MNSMYGDSLSDMGTVFRATGECIHHNRATFEGVTGRVWVEYLAAHLRLSYSQTNNFAYGGATTSLIATLWYQAC